MDSYKLRDIGATVSTFGDEYQTFSDVLNDMIKIDPRLDINDVQDLVDTLGGYEDFEESAKELCMKKLDGVNEDDDDPEAEWGDQMYCRQAGK
ncbi:hypothetical protein [Lactobacillus crispatus]|jgi:hypothetical protein|uniref:hypothetical protein n=2 Tax=Lactobacillus crispatus TaxID=47770 RepID=UPI000C79591A|nr:hypothetical protein [Lactobacillus crispatus]MBI1701795.1 hypothetical protein [Lactobacillus crispatus]MBI1717022.1 hypothetical protein [Lactobacillus crispatus]MCZ3674317.1 hypothetical protein [Lactobacillus crispatus]MCZ3682039.1 hypothetical protein [Lactobacillus crispatus]MCZ3862466.1 hypothetical protein [Lactobacillus crispatus]